MSNDRAFTGGRSPVRLLICPLRSKAPKAPSGVSKAQREAPEGLWRFQFKEAYHNAISVRDEVFELTRRDEDAGGKYFINRTPLEQWKIDKDSRGKGAVPGWEERDVLGYTRLSNDDIFYVGILKHLWNFL